MSHPLSITQAQAALVSHLLRMIGVSSHFIPDHRTPRGAPRGVVLLEARRAVYREGVSLMFTVCETMDHVYKCEAWSLGYLRDEMSTTGADGVEDILTVTGWLAKHIYGDAISRVLCAALAQAMRAHALIARSDQHGDSIDSGDAIDVCYDAVRVVLPTYTTSSDIEPATSQEK